MLCVEIAGVKGVAKNGELGKTTVSTAWLLISSAMISLEDYFHKFAQV